MRLRTGAAAVALLVVLGGLVAVGLGSSAAGGHLTERWVSDTARSNEVNHHAIGVGPEGTIVAPVAEVPHSDVPLTNTSCAQVRLAPDDGAVVWRVGVPAKACFTHALTQPDIADVDGDGTSEVVTATTEEALVVRDAATGDEEFRVSMPTYGYARPTIADFRPAPGKEVVVSDIEGDVAAVDADGHVLWRVALGDHFDRAVSVWNSPVVADVDADGAPEVVVGTSRGAVVLSADGRVERIDAGDATYLAVAQADDDAPEELLLAGTAKLRAVDGKTGAVQWRRDFGQTVHFRQSADVDGDGTPELLVGLADGEARALSTRTGKTEWSTTVTTADDGTLPPPVLADVSGDGSPEVVAVANDGTVAVLDAESGAELAAYQRSVPIWTFASTADIDGDGDAEVLVRYGDARVVALDYES